MFRRRSLFYGTERNGTEQFRHIILRNGAGSYRTTGVPCMLLVSCFWQMEACKTRALDRMAATVLTVTYKMLEASAKCPYNFSTQLTLQKVLAFCSNSITVGN